MALGAPVRHEGVGGLFAIGEMASRVGQGVAVQPADTVASLCNLLNGWRYRASGGAARLEILECWIYSIAIFHLENYYSSIDFKSVGGKKKPVLEHGLRSTSTGRQNLTTADAFGFEQFQVYSGHVVRASLQIRRNTDHG